MPKLVQINVALNKGSTGRIAEGIAITATKHGWDCYMVHGQRYVNPSAFPSYQVSSRFEERIHYVESILFDGQGKGSREATKRLINYLKSISPDIVHIHNIHGCYINYKILFDYLTQEDIAIVWTMHDCWPFTGHCVYFDKIGCNKWLTECNHCPQKKSFPTSLLIDNSRNNFNRKRALYADYSNLILAPVSNWLENLIKLSFLKGLKVKVVHNGVDLNVFKCSVNNVRNRYNLEDKFIVLGVADGYGDRKGLEEFVELSDELSDDYQLIMVGAEESELKLIPSNVIAMTRTNNQQELIDLYSAANVYINPTYEDNFPTTNIEALACDTPVITYRTGGSPESIIEDSTIMTVGNFEVYSCGCVVKQGDCRSLAKAIKYLKENPIKPGICRNRAENKFNQEYCFAQYVDIYEHIRCNS